MQNLRAKRRLLLVASKVRKLDEYRLTGVLNELIERYELQLLTSNLESQLHGWDGLEMTFRVNSLPVSARLLRSTRAFREVAGWRFRRRSVSFRTRFILKRLFKNLEIPYGRGWREILWGIRRAPISTLMSNLVASAQIALAGSRLVYPVLAWAYRRRLSWLTRKVDALSELIASSDYVVLLFDNLSPLDAMIMDECHRQEQRLLLVPINWDNLTSKSVLPVPAHLVAVFGSAMREQVSAIHEIAQERLVELGSPRIVHARQKMLEEPQDRRRDLILLAGASRHRNSLQWIPAVDGAIVDSGRPYRCLWRPYPRGIGNPQDFLLRLPPELKVTTVDLDILSNRSHRDPRVPFEERELSYGRYLNQLKSAHLVVSETTSVVLEAVACGIPVIVPCIKDRAIYGGEFHRIRGFVHLLDLFQMSEVRIVESIDELYHVVREQASADFSYRSPCAETLRVLGPIDRSGYANRLIDALDKQSDQLQRW